MRLSYPPYPFWSVWIYLSTSERLFLLLLGGMCVYLLYSGAITLARAWKVRGSLVRGEAETILAAMRQRSAKADKLRGAAFFLFGVVLFENMQWSYLTIDNSTTPGGWVVLQNFQIHFAFAHNVFFILLILHISGWLVSAFVNRTAVRLKPQGLV